MVVVLMQSAVKVETPYGQRSVTIPDLEFMGFPESYTNVGAAGQYPLAGRPTQDMNVMPLEET